MLVSLTVGKVDAGVAVLLTEDKRLVSFILLKWTAILTAILDRVPIDTPAFIYNLGLHC